MTAPVMRALRLLGVALACAAVVASPRAAEACGTCRGPGGAGSALTAPWQRWGASVAQTLRVGHGVFDERSRYHPLGDDSHDRIVELAFAGAMRPVPAVELGATTAYGTVLVGGPAFRSRRGALGDLSLRARWEVLSEPPLRLTGQQQVPSVGLTLTARLPTGPVDRVTDAGVAGPSPGTVGSTATSQGLGTTELAFAVDVRRTFLTRFQVGAVGEAAWRAPDDALGLSRELGPRGLLRLMGIAFVGEMTFGLFADLAAEGNVTYASRTSPDSGQRSFSLGASGSYNHGSGARMGLALSFQPPVDGLSTNAVVATGITTFLAFTR